MPLMMAWSTEMPLTAMDDSSIDGAAIHGGGIIYGDAINLGITDRCYVGGGAVDETNR
jgi:hypothetical protein